MKGFWKHIAASASISAGFVICALALAVSAAPVTTPAVQASGGGRSLSLAGSFTGLAEALDKAAGEVAAEETPAIDAKVETAAQPDPATAAPAQNVVTAPAPGETPREGPQAGVPSTPGEEPQAEVPDDQPGTSSVDPTLPAPVDLALSFDPASSPRTVGLSWQGVTPPSETEFRKYQGFRWSEGDFAAMIAIFEDLAALDPTLDATVQDLADLFALLEQPGLTCAERNAILEDAEADMDTLLAALVVTSGAEVFVEDLNDLAQMNEINYTSYSDTDLTDNTYYLYAVWARYWRANTKPHRVYSPYSNCEGVYTVAYNTTTPPAAPTGFTATAYDPGVALEWSRNTEADLAGYNVYVQGSTDPLNGSEPITSSTEYFHMTGAEGATYYVEAVNVEDLASTQPSAVSVLAPATVYGPDDPAWQYSGT
jgi:hypothetical protein